MPRVLPVEILELVTMFCSDSTLGELARVSTALNPVSTRVLYGSIMLSDSTRIVQCLETLACNTALACFVYTLSIRQYYIPSLLSDNISALASRAFKQTVNLISLSLRLGDSIRSDILTHAKFKLQHFACDVLSILMTEEYSITQFLETQPLIESLVLTDRSGPWPGELKPDALPRLHKISAPIKELRSLLPARISHIQSVHCQSVHYYDAEEAIREITGIIGNTLKISTTNLSLHLGFEINVEESTEWSETVLALMDLGRQVLCISALTLQVAYGAFDRITLSTHIPSILGSFYNIYTLTLVSYRQVKSRDAASISPEHLPPADESHNTKAHKTYLEAWRLVQPTLQRVCFPNRVYKYITHVTHQQDENENRVENYVARGEWILM